MMQCSRFTLHVKIGQKDLFCDITGMQSFVQYNKYGFTLFHIEKMQ